MKILQISPTPKSAISIVSKGISRNLKDIEFKLCCFHPKRPGAEDIAEAKKLLKWADVVDCQYWKSGSKMRETCPNEWASKPKILTHHNPYNLFEESWDDYKVIVVTNSYQLSQLPKARMIPLGVNLDFFQFNENYTKEKVVEMTVGRIEGKKGVEEIAIACQRLKYKFVLVGMVSDPKYLDLVLKEGKGIIDFRRDASDKVLLRSYYESAVHVCNSIDNFETGTLPILESMATGVPVLARNVGLVPDINNGKNLRLMDFGNFEIDKITESLRELMEDYDARVAIRNEAKKSIQARSDVHRAKDYAKLYKEVL